MTLALIKTALQPCQGINNRCHKLGRFDKVFQKFLCLTCFEHEYTQKVLADLDAEMRF